MNTPKIWIWIQRIAFVSFYIVYFFMTLALVDVSWIATLIFLGLCFLMLHYVSLVRQKYLLPPLSRAVPISLVIILVSLLLFTEILDTLGNRRMKEVVAKANEMNYPLAYESLKAANDKIEVEKNGAPLLLWCAQSLGARYEKVEKAKKEKETKEESPKKFQAEAFYPPQLTPAQIEEYKSLMDSTPEWIGLLRKALAMPQLRIALDFPDHEIKLLSLALPHLKQLRQCMSYLSLRCQYLFAIGQKEEALATLSDMAKIPSVLREESLLISQLVRGALQQNVVKTSLHALVYYSDQLTETEIQNMQSWIAPYTVFYSQEWANAMFLESVCAYGFVRYNKMEILEILGRSETFNLFFWAYYFVAPRGWFKLDIALLLKNHMHFVELCRQEEHVITQNILSDVKKGFPGNGSILYPITSTVLPSLDQIFVRRGNTLTKSRCVSLACALEIEKKKMDVYPKDLSFLGDAEQKNLVDPFAGKRLLYQPTEKGYKLYSLGENGVDDGGDLFDKSEKEKAKDVGIQVP